MTSHIERVPAGGVACVHPVARSRYSCEYQRLAASVSVGRHSHPAGTVSGLITEWQISLVVWPALVWPCALKKCRRPAALMPYRQYSAAVGGPGMVSFFVTSDLAFNDYGGIGFSS